MGNDPADLLVPLSELGVASAKGHPDARGWEVLAAKGIPTGHVADLIIDTRTAEVHAFIIELSGKSELGSSSYRVSVPAENARVEAAERRIHLDGMSWSEVALLPHYGESAAPPAPKDDDTVISEAPAAVPAALAEDLRMTLFGEEVEISKRTVDAGEVVVRKRVEEEAVREVVPLMREDVVIERRPFPEGVGFEPRVEGDVTYVPLVEEELVIEKRLVAREELVIRKRQLTEERVVEETVRKEVLDVRRPGDEEKG
jgi:uncharacterized protein (TIGR02271 family)